MNKKATRLLSVLLAVLMVVTMVPFMALSAAEPVQNIAADPVVWDGKVPASSDGTVATVEEWIFGTGAAAGKIYDFNWSAEYAEFGEQFSQYEHIEFNGTDTITIKTAAGLALFTVWSNVNTTTVGGMGTAFGNGAGMTHPLVFLQGKTIKLAADLYLNDPAVSQADWTNTTMPIFWDNIALENSEHVTNFTFDGQGHMVYGWYVNQTIAYDETNCQNNAWGFFGVIPTNAKTVIKGLALVRQYLKVDATIYTVESTIKDLDNTIENVVSTANVAGSAPGVCTVLAGGVYGSAPHKNGDLVVEDCIVDLKAAVMPTGEGAFSSGSYSCSGAITGGITSSFARTGYVYPEAKNEAPVKSAYGANDMAKWRVTRNVLVSVSIETSNPSWYGGSYASGLALDGWADGGGNSTYLDNVIVISFEQKGAIEADALVQKGVYTAGTGAIANRGIITTASSTNFYNETNGSNKGGVALEDILNDFDTKIVTATDSRLGTATTFATWEWSKGNYPLPMAYTASSFIQSVLSDAYVISTPEEFMAWKDNLDYKLVKLANDIDMAGYDWTPIQTWGGTFDGQGHAIYNLTSTPAPATEYPAPENNYHRVENMRGGLVNVAVDGLTFKNVAFMNYHFKSFAWWGGAHQGMLFASYAGATVTVENVIIAGRNDGGSEVGMFGGRGGAWSGKVIINNCAFICTDPAKTCVNSGFAQASSEHWGSGSAGYGTVNISNFYAVNLPDFVANQRNSSYNESSRVNASKIYATGPKDVAYYTINFGTHGNDVEDSYLTYADVSPEFYASIEGDEVTKADFVGEALDLGDGWTYADGLLPVPKCFDASVAEVLTATNGIKADDASDYLTSIGASIRLSQLAEKQGIRFSFATTAALDLLAKNADVYYGVLVAPTALIGDELDDEDEDVALFFANAEGYDAVLDVVDGKFNAALVNFAGVTTGDVRTVSFTVRGFVIVGEDILWLDSYACSAADVAAAYIAENAGSEDAEIAATIEKIEAIYSDLLAE